ncbi:MAG: HAMP domain-containing sensor histidine kinase, partial [Paenibacillaceae bacterium]
MTTIPIRLRLTLWYCLIFGLLMTLITTSIYLIHRTSHYKEIDRSLVGISEYILNETHLELEKGISLSEIQLEFKNLSLNGVVFAIEDVTGQSIAAGGGSIQKPDMTLPEMHGMKEPLHTFADQDQDRYRMYVQTIVNNDEVLGYVLSEYSLRNMDRSMNFLLWLIVSFTVFGLGLAALSGWYLARKTFQPIAMITDTAKAIAHTQGFEQRVMYDGVRDELGQLVETFNVMLQSLENAYLSQKRFIENASHELRAPLTTIRGNIDILQSVDLMPESEREEILDDMKREAIRMSSLVAELLTLARADAGQEIAFEVVDIHEIAIEVIHEIRKWNSFIEIECKLDHQAMVWGNRDLIKQLLIILTENAVRYTPHAGYVTIRTKNLAGDVLIEVNDTGIGVNEQELPHIFERFFRGEQARIRFPAGTGLGLPIA